jgi:hypothetical protein
MSSESTNNGDPQDGSQNEDIVEDNDEQTPLQTWVTR